MQLKDEIALVTGASRGIGKAIAQELAGAGATVVGTATSEQGARGIDDYLAPAGGRGMVLDVSEPESIAAVLKEIEGSLGTVTVLVNNAGITRDNILIRLKDDDWDEVLNVNLKGAFNVTRALTRSMMKRRDGVIINISSVVGLMGNAGQVNYAASKAGLHGMTRSVARELGSRGIRCNCIAPGYIRTDMTSELSEEQTEALQTQIALGRLGEPEDVAGVVRFLAGPAGRYITGQILAVDGGMAM